MRIKNNVPLKHKIAGGILAFFAFCEWIGMASFFESDTTDITSVLMLVFVALLLSIFSILFLTGVMCKINKRPVLHWVTGIVFLIWGFTAWIMVFTEDDISTLVAFIILGTVFTILSVLYLSGIMARIKYGNGKRKPNKSNTNKRYDSYYDSTTNMEDLLFSIDCMEGHEFEHFCAKLLVKNGFTNVEVTQASGDQGVDIIAIKDELKYAIQCKNYSSHLGNTPIQEVCAGKMFYQCHVAAVMTNTTFTSGAKELAKATGVLLWDRTMLEKLIKSAKC